MKRLLFSTLVISIPMILLTGTLIAKDNAVIHQESQSVIAAGEETAQVVATSCEAIVAREYVEMVVFMKVRMADIWNPISAESRNITRTVNAAPGDQLAIVSGQFIDCGRTQTLSEIGRAAPGDQLIAGSKYVLNRRLRTLAEIGRAAPGIYSVTIVGNRNS